MTITCANCLKQVEKGRRCVYCKKWFCEDCFWEHAKWEKKHEGLEHRVRRRGY
jgi:hypothetical protein